MMSEESERQSPWWAWAALAAVALVLVMVLGLGIAIRLPGVRQLIQDRVAEAVAERTGLALETEDLQIRLWRGQVIVEGVSLGTPREAPLLQATEVEVGWRLSSLWRGPFTLTRVRVTGPLIDLEAPLPPSLPTSDGGDSEFDLVIELFQVADGRVDGAALPEDLRHWLEEWWLQDLHIEGIYGPERLAASLESLLIWSRTDGGQGEIAIDGRVEGPRQGPWTVSSLTLQGEGLEGELTGTAGVAETDPLRVGFDLRLEPHLLIPVPAATDPVRLRGELDARRQAGRVEAEAVGIPLEIVTPWLAGETQDAEVLEGWRLDFDGDLSLEEGSKVLSPTGALDLRAYKADTTWATATIGLPSAASADRVEARIQAEILPDLAGKRTLRADLTAPSWTELTEAVLMGSSVQILDTDAAQIRQALASIGVVSQTESAEKGLSGVIQAQARASGPVADPQFELSAEWKDSGTDFVELAASGSKQQITVDSARGSIGGRSFQGQARVDLPLPIASAEALLKLEQPHPEVLSADLTIRLLDGTAEVQFQPRTQNEITSQLEARIPLASLQTLPELADTLSGLPVVQARGPVELEWQIPTGEWSWLVSRLGADLKVDHLRVGTEGSLEIDLRKPLAGTGLAVVNDLELQRGDLRVVAEDPIQLRLQKGEGILEAARLGTGGGVLEVEAWAELADEWRPGAPPENLIRRFQVEANGTAPMALLQDLREEIYTDGELQIAVAISGTPEALNGEIRALGPEAHLYLGGPEGPHLSGPVLELAFEGDRIRIARAELGLDAGRIIATGEVPLSTALGLLKDRGAGQSSPAGPLHLEWEIPETDWTATVARFGVEEPPESLILAARGEVELDPLRPLEAKAWCEISPLSVTTEGRDVVSEGPVRVTYDEGRMEIESLTLREGEQRFVVTGAIDVNRDWEPGQPTSALVDSLDLRGRGILAAALLNPFLAGGRAEGVLEIDFELDGTLEDPAGRVRIQGPEASVLFIAPYVARLEAPELDLELIEGRAQIRDGRVRLNDGDVELEGSLGLDGVQVMAAFDGLRFRLDQGLLVRTDGALNLELDGEGRGRLSGEIIVDQGSLTRSINLDRELISGLLSPIDLTGTEESPLEQIDLDLRLETRRGVRVRNNVADLAVRWNGVRVRGNLLQPVVDGDFAVEPGGRAFLFGQTLRIDRGVLTFPGQPGAEAILDLETTSSLDDPSISRLQGEDALALGSPEPAEGLEDRAMQAGWSAAAFVGEQVATRINEAVPGARFTFRPILIFGEADPGARLTIGREFSRYVTLAASIDLRNAERQTYLMDAHSLPGLPGLVVQVFTNDQEQEGVTLQHRLRFGRHRRTAPTGPNLRRLEIEEVDGVSRRELKRAVGISKGDRASDDDLFLAEVEVGEFLRRAGYPDARIEIEDRPVPDKNKVDLKVEIDAGPFVEFRFEGETLTKPLRRSITPFYRTDFYESVALQEMEAQTLRALRSLGFLHPQVEIEVQPDAAGDGRDRRTVIISTEGGEQVTVEALAIAGLAADEADQVAAGFSTRVQRVELAAAEPTADRRLLDSIRGLGYPRAQILGRNLSADGERLEVQVDPGAQRHLDAVTVTGVDTDQTGELMALTGLDVGDVARRDRIASGAMAIEREFQSRGYTDARVRPRLDVEDGEKTDRVELVYEVIPGTARTVEGTDIDGLRTTRKRWATNVAEMESGAPLREDEVAAARSRLYETGLFTMVGSDTFETDDGDTRVVFDVEERPRFSVAYGVRWDSDEETQGVIDVIDRNFLGRSVTLGLRALYKQDDRSLRLGAGVPRLFGSRAVLELFASYRDFYEEVETPLTITQFDEQITDVSLQFAYPFGAHIWGRIYGKYRTRESLITDIDQDPIFPLPPIVTGDTVKTPILGTLWLYDSRDRALVLARGTFASFDLSGPGRFLDSDFEYVRMFSQFNLYRPVGRWAGRGFSWAQSLRLGLADSFDQELFRGDRFFAGGQYSVRGYPTNSLGPVEILGDSAFPLGGKTLVVINQELRFDLLGPVAGLVFLDLGNVWEDTAEFSSDLFKSLGFGLRAVTPVGLLRLDFAFPLDRRDADPSSQIYFGFGNTF